MNGGLILAVVAVSAGCAGWMATLALPGWTRILFRWMRARWFPAAALIPVALLAVLMADPLFRLAPGTWWSVLDDALASPGLGGALLALLFAAAPVLADVAVQRDPARARRRARRAAATTTGALPILFAATLTSWGASDVWSTVLGGDLAPPWRVLALGLTGAWAPPGQLSVAHPAWPGAFYVAAATGAWSVFAAHLRHVGVFGRTVVVARHSERLFPWVAALGVGLIGFALLTWARGVTLAVAPWLWWSGAGSVVLVRWVQDYLLPLPGTAPGPAPLAAALPAPAPLAAVPPPPVGTFTLSANEPAPPPARAAKLAQVMLVGGSLLTALQLRWEHLVADPGYSIPLSSDAQSYFDESAALARMAAEQQRNLAALFLSGSTWFREPLYIYLLNGWLDATGRQELHTVFLSIGASLAWIVATFFGLAALLGAWPAALAALLLAVDGIWIRNSVVGLREETTGALLMATVAVLFGGWAARRRLYWLAPALAAGAMLTRLDTLIFLGPLLLWAALAQRWPLRRCAGMALVLGVLLLPTFAGYVTTRGEALPASTVIATNNWKEEFKDRIGEPGFEADRRVTAFDYLFKYHSLPQLVDYTTRGIVRIYGVELFDSLHYRLATWTDGWGAVLGLHSGRVVPLIFVAGCVGLLASWRRWRTRWLPVALCLVGVLPPIGFIAGVPQQGLYQARYAYMVAPFAVGVLAWALCSTAWWAASTVWTRIGGTPRMLRPPRNEASGEANPPTSTGDVPRPKHPLLRRALSKPLAHGAHERGRAT